SDYFNGNWFISGALHFKSIIIIQTIDPDFLGLIGTECSVYHQITLFPILYPINLDIGLSIWKPRDFKIIILVGADYRLQLGKMIIIVLCYFYDIVPSSLQFLLNVSCRLVLYFLWKIVKSGLNYLVGNIVLN